MCLTFAFDFYYITDSIYGSPLALSLPPVPLQSLTPPVPRRPMFVPEDEGKLPSSRTVDDFMRLNSEPLPVHEKVKK